MRHCKPINENPRKESRCSPGFTLVELIIATAISGVVIGILSVCMSFALRTWENNQGQQADNSFLLADLLRSQLAQYQPTPIKFPEGTQILFSGQANSLVFVTNHSVKAISHGVPVVVRYEYDPRSRVLSYSEMPLDPYHPKPIQVFMGNREPGADKRQPRVYGVEIQEFSLAYAGIDSKEFSQSWQKENSVPIEVLLRWRAQDSRIYSRVMMVNCPFEVEVARQTAPAIQGGAAQ